MTTVLCGAKHAVPVDTDVTVPMFFGTARDLFEVTVSREVEGKKREAERHRLPANVAFLSEAISITRKEQHPAISRR